MPYISSQKTAPPGAVFCCESSKSHKENVILAVMRDGGHSLYYKFIH